MILTVKCETVCRRSELGESKTKQENLDPHARTRTHTHTLTLTYGERGGERFVEEMK